MQAVCIVSILTCKAMPSMKNIMPVSIIAVGIMFASVSQAETIELEKKDYLKLIVSSYVNGFNEFDTTVVTFDDSISVGIYFDSNKQNKQRADQLAKRFRDNIPGSLEPYNWAEDIKVLVSVYEEDRHRGD